MVVRIDCNKPGAVMEVEEGKAVHEITEAIGDMIRNMTHGPAISGKTSGHFSLGEVGRDQGGK